jgi:uncharacterized membrane protein
MQRRERVVFLDLARGLAIFFMILQHAMIVYEVSGGEKSALGRIVLLFGTAPAAPVFLLVMGIFLARSERGLPYAVRRGIQLLVLGYLLNLLRFTVPVLITGERLTMVDGANSPAALFWAVDILQMAGLSFALLGVLKVCLPFRWAWIVLAAGVAILSPLLSGRGGQNVPVNLLWGTGENVFFPLFPWIVYPLVGMTYSSFVLETADRRRTMKRTALAGLLLCFAGLGALFVPEDAVFALGNYFRSGLGIHLVVLGLVFMWLALCWVVAQKHGSGRIAGLLCFWSRNVTVAYFVQWVLIGWGIVLFGANRHGSLAALGLGVAALLLTHGLVKIYAEWRLSKRLKGDA